MKTLLKYLIAIGFSIWMMSMTAEAQLIVQGNAWIKIYGSNSRVVCVQDLRNINGGHISATGTMILKKNLVNIDPGSQVYGNYEFSGSLNQQVIGSIDISHLTLNNPSGLTLGGNCYTYSTKLLQGRINLGNYDYKAVVVSGNFSSQNMFVPTGDGHLILHLPYTLYPDITPIEVPVGDDTGLAEYSPVLFRDFHTTAWDVYLYFRLKNMKYPDEGITGNYLNRYWEIQVNPGDLWATFQFQYLTGDVTGSESLLACTKTNPLPWVTYGTADTISHLLTVTGSITDGAFTGLKSTTVPPNQELANITTGSGSTACYDALDTLTVAGQGRIFIVEPGGSVTLIAGQRIFLREETTVLPGGYLLGRITTGGEFCFTSPENASVAASLNEKTGLGEKFTGITEIHSGSCIRLFPNPTPGSFRLEITAGNDGLQQAEIMHSNGMSVQTLRFCGERTWEGTLAGYPPGLYLVRVRTDHMMKILKIVKN